LKIVITNTVVLNGGDAAILLGIIATLKRAYGEFELTVLDQAPEVCSRLYPGIDFDQLMLTIPTPRTIRGRIAARLMRHRKPTLRSTMIPPARRANFAVYRDADLIVNTGGTYLAENYDLSARFAQMAMAVASGTPTIMFTQSLGPFRNPRNIAWLRLLMPRTQLVLLRDARSRTNLVDLGIGDENIRIVPDAAFALAEPNELDHAKQRALADRPVIAISVRNWSHFRSGPQTDKQARYREAIARTAERLIRQLGARILFVSSCQGVPEYWIDDAQEASAIAALIDPALLGRVDFDAGFHTPAELIELLRTTDLVIATRMHMAILALCAGTPVLPIAYEFKTTELFCSLGLREWVSDIEASEAAVLGERALAFWHALPSIRPTLFERVKQSHYDAIAVAELLPPLCNSASAA
jgi:colanic acid/amylovoran biosynthesis protein